MIMISREEAITLTKDFLATLEAPADDPWVVREDSIREGDFGWALPFVNKRYQESGDWRDERLGHSAVIVDRQDSGVHLLDSSKQLDMAIAEYVLRREP